MNEIHEKGKKWNETIEEMHGGSTQQPIVAGNYFTCHMSMEFTQKRGKKIKMEEIGLYKVENGKIISEQFFS